MAARLRATTVAGPHVTANPATEHEPAPALLDERGDPLWEAPVRSLLDSSLDAVIVIDREGRVMEWSGAAERTFGRSRSDVLGRDLAELIIPPALRSAHRHGLRRVQDTGPSGQLLGQRVELTAMRADGSTFPVELSVSAAGNL